MTAILRLNRGSYGTLDLNALTDEGIHLRQGWQPRLAGRRAAPFGGRLWNRVEEQIPLRAVSITSGGEVLEMVQSLIEALEQAYAWSYGAEVDPVILEYQASESGLVLPQQAPLWRLPKASQEAQSEELLTLEAGFDEVMNSWFVDFTLRVMREGEWLDATPETPAASASTTNPGAMSVTFADDIRLPSPVSVTITESGAGNTGGAYEGFLMLADQADKLYVEDTSAWVSSAGIGATWSTISPAPGANGNSYRRTGAVNGTQLLQSGSLSANLNSAARLWAVYFAIRNLSSGNFVPWEAYVILNRGSGERASRKVILEPSLDVYPRIQPFGIIPVPEPLDLVWLYVTPLETAAAGDEIDVDYCVLLAVDEHTAALGFANDPDYTQGIIKTVEDRSLTHREPLIQGEGGGFLKRTEGNARFYSVGKNLTARVVATLPTAGSSDFVITSSTGARAAFTLTATRRAGYLTPK